MGVSGSAFQGILRQMTAEMGMVTAQKAAAILDSFDALIDAVQETGIVEEEIFRTQGRISWTDQHTQL